MSSFVDTNVILRYLIADQPALTDQAARIVDGVEDLVITPEVIAETAYTLISFYKIPRDAAMERIIKLVEKENVSVFGINDTGLVIQALLLCRPSGRISVADAMVWASARSAGARVIYSFDKRFLSDGLEVRQER
ncbi:MAG: PIN domain-containing protein [Chloroflexi bacterium]|nr:PIN domain-containing protein [Chloroflexota bacterium]